MLRTPHLLGIMTIPFRWCTKSNESRRWKPLIYWRRFDQVWDTTQTQAHTRMIRIYIYIIYIYLYIHTHNGDQGNLLSLYGIRSNQHTQNTGPSNLIEIIELLERLSRTCFALPFRGKRDVRVESNGGHTLWGNLEMPVVCLDFCCRRGKSN